MNRPSRLVLIFRMFLMIFGITFVITRLFNLLSPNMFQLVPTLIASVMLTVLHLVVSWVFVVGANKLVYGNNSEYQRWKASGGRIYWDTLGWPINSASEVERRTGLAEPKYTNFVPPHNWLCQCPVCGARVEKPIDVCWNCNYGADGDSTAYVRRWGEVPASQQPILRLCSVPQPEPVQQIPPDWRPMRES